MCVILLVLIILGIELIVHNNVNHLDCNFLSMFQPKVLDASNRLIVICFKTQNFPKNITNAKMSCVPLDIQRSKLAIAKTHSTKSSKTYMFVLSFQPTLLTLPY
jgi:hypothetical protein